MLRIIDELSDVFGVELSVLDIFDNPTVPAVCALLRAAAPGAGGAS